MGLFGLFNKKNAYSNSEEVLNPSIAISNNEIPENIFIEKELHSKEEDEDKNRPSPGERGINMLFMFLEKNHEKKGYDDALINPDSMHLDQNIEALKNDLERTIRKVKTFYEDFIREINFHISSRSRSGMIDTVEELTVKKETAESHIIQIQEIEQDAKNDAGVAQGLILSYTRGFKNGLAAISHHTIMKKNF